MRTIGEGRRDDPDVKTVFTEVRTFKAKAHCKNCGGLLEFTGIVKTCHPPLYEHDCKGPGCKKVNLNNKYPFIDYEEA